MGYDQQTWVNGSGGGTPRSADRLNHQEAGIKDAHDRLDADVAVLESHVSATDPHGDRAYSDAALAEPAELPVFPASGVVAASLETAETAWFTANRMILDRFVVERATRLALATLPCTVASGNIEIAIYSVTRTDVDTYDLVKVGGSGVIACPTPAGNSISVPFTAPLLLDRGQYAVGLWCNNTTATFLHAITNVTLRAGWSLSDGSANAGGAHSVITGTFPGGRSFAVSLEPEIPSALTAILIGDSITANQAWFSLSNATTGSLYRPTNEGVAGSTTADIASRLAADVTSVSPTADLVVVLGGTNDIGQSLSSATITANLDTIVDAIVADGSDVILCTVPPRLATGGVPLSGGQQTALNAVNTWIRAQHNGTTVKVADWTVELSTGDGTTPDSAYFSDGVHPSGAGAAVMADILSPLLAA